MNDAHLVVEAFDVAREAFSSLACVAAVEMWLIVTDAPPLSTLAVAERLDYILYPEFQLLIPDAVFYEAIASARKLGVQEILDWYRTHTDAVRVFGFLSRPRYF